jgi:hypothetical protein
MLDSMSAYDAQRAKLEECIVLASKIAACEADERIKRATVMYCMERTVDGFPVSSSICMLPRILSLRDDFKGQPHLEQQRLHRQH